MNATVKQKPKRRARRPILNRPIRWAKMTAAQRTQACETIRDREWFRADVPDHDSLEETFRWVLEEKFGFTGVEDWKFYWGLGHCQGDGVAFTGDVNVEALAFKHDALMKYIGPIMLGKYDCQFVCSVKQDAASHYCHWNSMTVTVEPQHEYDHDCREWPTAPPTTPQPDCRACLMDEWASEVEATIADIVKDASRACERAGYDEIDHTRSDEYVGDLIEANDWEFSFDEDGVCEWE